MIFLGKIYYFFENFVTLVSSLTIIAISLERYFAICGSSKVSCEFFLQNKSIIKKFN